VHGRRVTADVGDELSPRLEILELLARREDALLAASRKLALGDDLLEAQAELVADSAGARLGRRALGHRLVLRGLGVALRLFEDICQIVDGGWRHALGHRYRRQDEALSDERREAFTRRVQLALGPSPRVVGEREVHLHQVVHVGERVVAVPAPRRLRRDEVRVAQDGAQRLLLVETIGERALVVRERSLLVALEGRDRVEDVRRVVLRDTQHTAVDHRPAELVGKQPHRVDLGAHVARHLAAVHLLDDDAAPLATREARLDRPFRRVEVLEGERRSPDERHGEALGGLRHAEERPIEVDRKARIALVEPGLIVGAGERNALRPGDGDGHGARRVRAVLPRDDELPRLLDVGERRAVDSWVSTTARVVGEAIAAECARPGKRHRRKRRRLGRCVSLPDAISGYRERAVYRSEMNSRFATRLGRIARVGRPGDEHLGRHLGHTFVDHTLAPEHVGRELPERDLGEEAIRIIEREVRDDRDREEVLEVLLEGLGKNAQAERLDDLHQPNREKPFRLMSRGFIDVFPVAACSH